MIGSALALVLARLDQIESPVFSHEELARFPAADLAVLFRDGILCEGVPAEEIDRPSRLRGGGRLAVRRTARGIFGCPCEGDPYFDPIPLTEDDVRLYEVSIDRLIDRVRRDNGIDGTGYAASGQTFALGRKDVEAWGAVDVYFALGLHDDAAVLSACLHLKTETSPRRVVLLVPTAVATSPDRRRAIDATGVLVEPLRDPASRGSLVVSWIVVLGAPDVRHEVPVPKVLRIFRREGEIWTVAYDGRSAPIANSLGMTYIQQLLERPSTPIPTTLLASASGRAGRSKILESSTRLAQGKKPDDSTLDEQGWAELARLEAQAKQSGDTKRLGELRMIRSEMEPDRRERRGLASTESKATKGARQSVSAAIRRAITAISKRHASLGRHLTDSIEYGQSILYKGDPKDRWATEGGST